MPPTWQQLKEFAFGRMSIRPKDFYRYTIEEFLLAARGFRDGEIELMKKFRLVAWATMAPHAKDFPKTPEDWMPLSTEKETTLTKADALLMKEKLYELNILRRN